MKEGLTAKFQLMIEPSLLERIDDWRFNNRVSSRAHAMRQLMMSALDNNEENGPAEAATSPSHVTSNP